MKVRFKFCGSEREVWATRDNVFGQHITAQPNTSTLRFVSEHGDIELSMKIDERNRVAEYLAHGMQNEWFEFDFSQPLPKNRLNPPLINKPL